MVFCKILPSSGVLLGVNCRRWLPMMLESFSRVIILSDGGLPLPEYTSPNFFFSLQLDPPPPYPRFGIPVLPPPWMIPSNLISLCLYYLNSYSKCFMARQSHSTSFVCRSLFFFSLPQYPPLPAVWDSCSTSPLAGGWIFFFDLHLNDAEQLHLAMK